MRTARPGGSPPRKSPTKSRKGCKTCKKRHIRCDETFPQCRNCIKHNCRCDYMDQPAAGEEPLRRSAPPDLMTSPELQASLDQWRITGECPIPELRTTAPEYWTHFSTIDLRLIHHMVTLSIDLQSRGYAHCTVWAPNMSILIALGLQSDFVMSAVLAFSASHLAWQTRNYETENLAYYHRGVALKGLHEAIGAFSRENSESILAASMLLSWLSTEWRSWASLHKGMSTVMNAMRPWLHESELALNIGGQRTMARARTPATPTFPGHQAQPHPDDLNRLHQAVQGLNDLRLRLANNQELLDHVEELIAYVQQIQQEFPLQAPDTAFARLQTVRSWLFWLPPKLFRPDASDVGVVAVMSHFYATALVLEPIFPEIGGAYLGSLAVSPIEKMHQMLLARRNLHPQDSGLQVALDLMRGPAQMASLYSSRNPQSSMAQAIGDSNDILELSQKSSGGNRGNQSPASFHSQNSRGSSPPRASSIGANGGHITPDTIPFQAFQIDAYQDELYRPFVHDIEKMWAMPPELSFDQYRYTAIQSEEVRLMVLYPGRFDDGGRVSCGLKVMPLHRLEGSQLVYQALSYAWGPKTNLQVIWIVDVPASYGEQTGAAVSGESNANVGSRMFSVRPNLHAALRRLRSESEELWFWIDAICIDQENLVEKADQLPRMLDIYCNAWSVCIWLGEPDWHGSFGSNEPFDLIATIINLKLLDYIVEASTIDEQMMSSLIAFAKLLKRPWFRRRWVIQEVSSSTRASVQYGHKKVNWIDFADAIQLFALKLDRIRALYRGSRLFERDPDALSHVEAAGACAIVRATNEVLRKGEDGRIVARLCDIETLVMRFVHFQASNPRDTIFALWSLADVRNTSYDHFPALQRQLTVPTLSYTQPCESIYIDFVCHCIRLHESLDIICRHWALPLGDDTQIFPPPPRTQSWVGTTTNSPFGMYLDSGGRMNGDSLVGSPGRKVYNASNNTVPAAYTLVSPGTDPVTMLRVTGYIISRVSLVSPRIVDGIVPYDALRLLGWTDRTTVDTIPDRLWRTLVADRAIDGSKAPSWWRRAGMFALSMASRDGDLSTQRMLLNKSLPQTVHEYLQRVQAMVWNRRIFALESTTASGTDAVPLRGLVGLGPRDTRQGDCACILMGCSVPVILREVPSTERNGVFELVGECYIHGVMDGEALGSTPSEAWSSVKEFNLI